MRRATTTDSQTSSESQRDISLTTQALVQAAADITVRDSSHSHIVTGWQGEQSSDEQEVMTVREYDTNQPVDPVTGTPPLKRETEYRRQKLEQEQQGRETEATTTAARQMNSQVRGSEASASTLTGHETEQSGEQTHTQDIQKRGLNPLQRVLCGLGLLAVAAVAVWLLRKRLKRLI